MSHTPGPWAVGGESGNDGEAEEIVAADRTICWTADTFTDEEGAAITDEDRANARLIAAAPELLAACKYLLENAEAAGWSEFMLADARAAIANAEGRGE